MIPLAPPAPPPQTRVSTRIRLVSSNESSHTAFSEYCLFIQLSGGIQCGILRYYPPSQRENVGTNFLISFQIQTKPMCFVPPSPNLRFVGADRSSSSAAPYCNEGFMGLENIGNTCFMNSVLQTLLNSRELRDYFLAEGQP